jgi:hypothetical protein
VTGPTAASMKESQKQADNGTVREYLAFQEMGFDEDKDGFKQTIAIPYFKDIFDVSNLPKTLSNLPRILKRELNLIIQSVE